MSYSGRSQQFDVRVSLARKTLEAIFTDTTVSQGKTREVLGQPRDEIDEMIDALTPHETPE